MKDVISFFLFFVQAFLWIPIIREGYFFIFIWGGFFLGGRGEE